MKKPLFEMIEVDHRTYEQELKDFLPEKMIDIHTHVWRDSDRSHEVDPDKVQRTVTWPSLVAKDQCVEDLIEGYRMIFPGKEVTPLMFTTFSKKEEQKPCNDYCAEAAAQTGFPALYYVHPEQTAEEVEAELIKGNFIGLKGYLDLSPAYLPEKEIRILDFFPHHILKKINEMGLIIMLHIPRPGRLKDPVNLAEILEIKRLYPNIKLIIAHIGRAYTESDIGNAFKVLSAAPDLMFDFCANTCEVAMTKLLQSVGPEHVMFGSDMPITRMRMRRIEENNTYINLIPKGMYGDPSQDSHLREVSEEEGKNLTLFMYEELKAFKRAAATCNLSRDDIEKVFYGNAHKIITEAAANLEAWKKNK